MTAMTVGQRVEDWCLYGLPSTPLSKAVRAEVIDFAASFEECNYTSEQLARIGDAELISAAYWAMADYTRGQL